MAQPQDYEWFFAFGPEAGAGGEAGCADFGSDYEKFEGRLSTPVAAGYTMSVDEGGGAVVVTVLAANSNYYLTSATGGMLAAIMTALNASALAGTYTLTIDDSDAGTGRVTISATGVASFAITWPDTTLRDALGFTGSVSGAATYISPSGSPYIWLPDRRRVDPPTPQGYVGFPVPNTIVTVAPSGHSKAISMGYRYASRYQVRYMRGNKVWRRFEQVTNESLENFHELIIGRGVPVRYHLDRSNDTRYVTWRMMPTWAVRPEIPAYVGRGCVGADSLWAYGEVEVIEYIE